MTQQLILVDGDPVPLYNLDNPEFLEFFKKTTGYRLVDCECGWERVKTTLANPSVPIESLSFTYSNTGEPLPENDALAMRNSWAKTRQKLQDRWDIFTGVKTFYEVYRYML